MTKKRLTNLTRGFLTTELIGLGETQERIYEGVMFTKNDGILKQAYDLHQQELELLIKYQKEKVK